MTPDMMKKSLLSSDLLSCLTPKSQSWNFVLVTICSNQPNYCPGIVHLNFSDMIWVTTFVRLMIRDINSISRGVRVCPRIFVPVLFQLS